MADPKTDPDYFTPERMAAMDRLADPTPDTCPTCRSKNRTVRRDIGDRYSFLCQDCWHDAPHCTIPEHDRPAAGSSSPDATAPVLRVVLPTGHTVDDRATAIAQTPVGAYVSIGWATPAGNIQGQEYLRVERSAERPYGVRRTGYFRDGDNASQDIRMVNNDKPWGIEVLAVPVDLVEVQARRIEELTAERDEARSMIGMHDPTGADHMEDAARLAVENDDLRAALRALDDGEECTPDHDGGCQTHGPGDIPCPVAAARALLEEIDDHHR